jgi:hypothetical protein
MKALASTEKRTPLRHVLGLASFLTLTACTTGSEANAPLMGLTKEQVVERIGFPASSSLLNGSAQGGPGYEEWIYYQKSSAGEIEPVGIFFSSSRQTFGQVVSYPSEIRPDRILRMNDWNSFGEIFRHQAKAGR